MEDVAVIGLDLAKSVFQVHGIDAEGQVVLRRRLSRSKLLSFFAALPRCRVAWLVWRPVRARTTGHAS